MTPFTDALTQLGRNPDDPTQASQTDQANQPDLSAVAYLVAKTPAKTSQRADEEASNAFFRNADIAHYLLAETASRHDHDDAYIPYRTAYEDDHWLRQAVERIASTSTYITAEEAVLWAKRADRAYTRWEEEGY